MGSVYLFLSRSLCRCALFIVGFCLDLCAGQCALTVYCRFLCRWALYICLFLSRSLCRCALCIVGFCLDLCAGQCALCIVGFCLEFCANGLCIFLSV